MTAARLLRAPKPASGTGSCAGFRGPKRLAIGRWHSGSSSVFGPLPWRKGAKPCPKCRFAPAKSSYRHGDATPDRTRSMPRPAPAGGPARRRRRWSALPTRGTGRTAVVSLPSRCYARNAANGPTDASRYDRTFARHCLRWPCGSPGLPGGADALPRRTRCLLTPCARRQGDRTCFTCVSLNRLPVSLSCVSRPRPRRRRTSPSIFQRAG